MLRLSRSLSRFETQDIKTQPMNQPLFECGLLWSGVRLGYRPNSLSAYSYPPPVRPHLDHKYPILLRYVFSLTIGPFPHTRMAAVRLTVLR